MLFQELPGCLNGRAQVVRDALHQLAQPGAGFAVKGFQVDTHSGDEGVTAVSGLPEVVQYLTALEDLQSSKGH